MSVFVVKTDRTHTWRAPWDVAPPQKAPPPDLSRPQTAQQAAASCHDIQCNSCCAGVPPFFPGRGQDTSMAGHAGAQSGAPSPDPRPFPCSVRQTTACECRQSALRRLLQRDKPALSRSRGDEGTAAFGTFGFRWRAAGLPGRISAALFGQHEEEVFLQKHKEEEPRAVGRTRTNAGGRGSRPHAAPRVVQGEHAGLHVVKARVTPPRLWWCLFTQTNEKTKRPFEKEIKPGLDPEADRRWTVGRQSMHLRRALPIPILPPSLG